MQSIPNAYFLILRKLNFKKMVFAYVVIYTEALPVIRFQLSKGSMKYESQSHRVGWWGRRNPWGGVWAMGWAARLGGRGGVSCIPQPLRLPEHGCPLVCGPRGAPLCSISTPQLQQYAFFSSVITGKNNNASNKQSRPLVHKIESTECSLQLFSSSLPTFLLFVLCTLPQQ